MKNVSGDVHWQLEFLIVQAFKRTKERFLSYFLTMVASFGLGLLLLLGLLLIGGFFYLLYFLTKSAVVGILLIILFIILLFIVVYFFSFWVQLVLTQIIIQRTNVGIIETFRNTRPLVKRYIWVMVLFSFFLIGLLPFWLLSGGIVLVLWLYWASFITFVFLDKDKKGLENLWYSKALIKQNFWAIAWRMLFVQFAFFFLNVLFINFNDKISSFAAVAISVISAPFTTSFSYEIYRILPEPAKVKKSKIWGALSLIGLVLLMIALVLSLGSVVNLIEDLKDINPQQLFSISSDV